MFHPNHMYLENVRLYDELRFVCESVSHRSEAGMDDQKEVKFPVTGGVLSDVCQGNERSSEAITVQSWVRRSPGEAGAKSVIRRCCAGGPGETARGSSTGAD